MPNPLQHPLPLKQIPVSDFHHHPVSHPGFPIWACNNRKTLNSGIRLGI